MIHKARKTLVRLTLAAALIMMFVLTTTGTASAAGQFYVLTSSNYLIHVELTNGARTTVAPGYTGFNVAYFYVNSGYCSVYSVNGGAYKRTFGPRWVKVYPADVRARLAKGCQ